MAISVTCICGAKIKAPDEAAGKKGKCPRCHQGLDIPYFVDENPFNAPVPEAGAVKVEPSPRPNPPPNLACSRLAWKCLGVFALVAALSLLLAPAGYRAWSEHSERSFRERIQVLKAEGDREAVRGDYLSAVTSYRLLLEEAIARPSSMLSDEVTRKTVVQTRANLRKVIPLVEEQYRLLNERYRLEWELEQKMKKDIEELRMLPEPKTESEE
jgi:hypothetical protein